ncbi:phosphoglycerate mutase-like protein [Serendipita vermifera]|nr:phosphoglycerate mutase-like protein [Serendipita vermifera]
MSIIPLPEYRYEVVTGWFMQDQNASQVVEFPASFGLLESSSDGWKKLKEFIAEMNGDNRVPGTIHKVFFFGRHGQGWHNIAESKYGTQAWDDYWSKLNGDGELVWGPDAELTPLGIEQAQNVSRMWKEEQANEMPLPDMMYLSPFRRALHTDMITFNGWFFQDGDQPGLEASQGVGRIVLEDLHETSGVHTCDLRNPKSKIHEEFPLVLFENGFAEEDPLWTPDHRETPDEQDVRSKRAMAKMMTADGAFISVTSHSGTMASIFRVIGHRPYPVTPGGVVPVLVKATQTAPPKP